jgi:hypothetical protein
MPRNARYEKKIRDQAVSALPRSKRQSEPEGPQGSSGYVRTAKSRLLSDTDYDAALLRSVVSAP